MIQEQQAPSVETPCVRICKIENDVCIGCHRTLDEIGAWMNANSEEKLAILAAAAQRHESMAIDDQDLSLEF
ncbi:MAG: DUF1289 domain-containing protein [Pseudomonadales bacterium]|nr:DUF1289 domain-containing protein [Pseudomonadales bacterium]MDG1443464.1 DUF1289 domain-containing protein [Pseudomonadales bacterium]